jgi:hypothetical protein
MNSTSILDSFEVIPTVNGGLENGRSSPIDDYTHNTHQLSSSAPSSSSVIGSSSGGIKLENGLHSPPLQQLSSSTTEESSRSHNLNSLSSTTENERSQHNNSFNIINCLETRRPWNQQRLSKRLLLILLRSFIKLLKDWQRQFQEYRTIFPMKDFRLRQTWVLVVIVVP